MSAVISKCGLYRYQLHRNVDPTHGGKVVFIGINPSTADAKLDDPTIRRLKSFTHQWGYGEFSIVNVFAFRSANPRDLADAKNPVGPDNNWWINNEIESADLVVAMWGDENKVPPHWRIRFSVINAWLQGSKCFGKTLHGHPKHPLYLSSTTHLENWK